MSRKHFEALANALASIRPFDPDDRDIWLNGVRAVASVCQGANGRFDRGRFIEACETR